MNNIDKISPDIGSHYITEYYNIIDKPMKLYIKKELLLQLIIKLDKEINKIFRKKMIITIQKTLHILDNIVI